MRLLGLLVWAIAVVLGFFISGAVSSAFLMPLAPADAGVGFALLVGLARTAVWVAVVLLAARLFRAVTQKSNNTK